MAELRWKTPVPLQSRIESERAYLQRLATWLSEQEQSAEYEVEANIALGGRTVAERIFGFEDEHSGYTPPDEVTLLTGPAAPRKFIVIGLHIGTKEDTISAEIYVRKAAKDIIIAILDPGAAKEKDIIGGSAGAGAITLDAPDESIVLKTLATASGDYGWAGSYLDVE